MEIWLRKHKKLPIKQRKGEAEMLVVKWLVDAQTTLNPGDIVGSMITSVDIDAVVIHLFVLPLKWPRRPDGMYANTVLVLLQKSAGIYDIYNMTAFLEHLEQRYQDKYIGVRVAALMCIGGNDFLPKLWLSFGMSNANQTTTHVAISGYRHVLAASITGLTCGSTLKHCLHKNNDHFLVDGVFLKCYEVRSYEQLM